MKRFVCKSLSRAALIIPCLFLIGNTQAIEFSGYADSDKDIGVTVDSQQFGLLDIVTGVPKFSMSGAAYAYEGQDDFDYGPADKVTIGGPGALNPERVDKTDQAYVSQAYGDPQVLDWALARAEFQGIPLTTLSSLTGIHANLSTWSQTQESSVFPALATATINDPFLFSGLTGNESINFFSSLGADLEFMIDTGGLATSHEIRQYYDAILTIDGVDEILYSLVIAVGTTASGAPDLVIEFSSSDLLGLDDAALVQEIMDTFAFDPLDNTFTLGSDVTIYDGAVPIADSVNEFSLAFNSGSEIDPYNPLYLHSIGPGSVGGANGTSIPTPHSPYLLLTGLFMVVYWQKRRLS